MTIAYDWLLNQLEASVPNSELVDVINRVHWTLRATDHQNNTAEHQGVVELDAADPSSFTPYGNVSGDMALGWIEAGLGAELDTIKAELTAELAALRDDPLMVRARDAQGRFIADDPFTPDVDEAWVPQQ